MVGLRRLVPLLAVAWAGTDRFIIVSQPAHSKIVQCKIASLSSGYTDGAPPECSPLIDTGVNKPQGLAMDEIRSTLYVADPQQQRILSYKLRNQNGLLYVDQSEGQQPKSIWSEVHAHWVAIDAVGNVLFADQKNSKVFKVSATSIADGSPEATPIYSSEYHQQVAMPTGIATDSINVFWGNMASGESVGSVIRAAETPPDSDVASAITAISSNTAEVHGVCIVKNNIVYTATDTYVYGISKNGGVIATITEKMGQPRGCVFDGDGTVYVADRQLGKVMSFPGATMAPQEITEVKNLEDAYGVAAYTVTGSAAAFSFLVATLALALGQDW